MSFYSITRLLPLSPPQLSLSTTTSPNPTSATTTTAISTVNSKPSILSNIVALSLSLSFTLCSPLPSLALPSLTSKSPPFSSPTTPFSQSKNLPLGLENGKIRGCPSINPGCVTTNPKSSNFEFPWQIPSDSTENAVQKLQEAILTTQKNAEIQVVEDTPNGQYLRAVVDGGFGRDVMEFLVKGDVVAYRCMATKVTYIYPFTTAFGDSKGQQERMSKIVEQLGWYVPNLDLMD
ncbi:thylakoid lumenal 17.9 kDa protein, chloroplastic-like [Chenopodium quinoa]|uniref:thylakoid lumenal 17.9 kDa protein, chloroplastic-like n=1 Tax=Chenopodium quinoa TaxID=63459 RepID=UPI000B76EFCF|nr:thylakoid lumenal 17.9 kDa protein, chloroplastic-like [Chenopodium quinoa]